MSRHLLLLGLYFVSSTLAFSQYEIDNKEYNFSGNINVNNNGVSWVPLFTMGEPS